MNKDFLTRFSSAQTRFLLKHYGEEPGDCEEVGLGAISALARAGILL